MYMNPNCKKILWVVCCFTKAPSLLLDSPSVVRGKSNERSKQLTWGSVPFTGLTILCALWQEPDMMYKTREDQGQLLQQVLAASETDADEERIPGEAGRAGASGASRRTGSLASMSGGDDAVYMEYRRQYLANIKHPLFKKFRGWTIPICTFL